MRLPVALGRLAVTTVVATCAITNASADVRGRQPVYASGGATASATPIHGTVPGRPATGAVVAITPTPDGSRVTVALDTPRDGAMQLTDEIPSTRHGDITRWTDRFDAVEVGDEVTARILDSGAGPRLTSLAAQTPAVDAGEPDFGPRWTTFGPAFRPWRLPQSWDLQDAIGQTFRDGVLSGAGWWQADPLSFWQLNAPGPLYTAPSMNDCEQGVPPGSWLRFGEVREAYDGAIGVATYCSDAAGRSAFEIVLDYRVDYDLDVVAAHEIGHGIGFGHSDDLAATMWPVANPKNALGTDDLDAIRAMYPGRIAAYATLPDGFSAVASDPRVKRALVRVVPVGEPGLICDRNAVRVRVDPPAARESFRGDTYDPATGIAIADGNPIADSVCEFHVETRPRSEDDGGPGPVSLTPVYPGTTVQQAAEADIRLPRPPLITGLTPTPQTVHPGDRVTLRADVSDLDGDLATVAWDLDADGAFDDASSADTSTSFATTGTKQVAALATDSAGLTAARSASVSVTPAPVAAAPAGGGFLPARPGATTNPGTGSAPTPGSAPTVRRLVITSARLTRARRLRIRATFTSRADALKVRVTVRARGRTRTYYQAIRGGRISFDRAMSRGQRGTRRVTVTLTFRGSAAVARTSTTVHLR